MVVEAFREQGSQYGMLWISTELDWIFRAYPWVCFWPWRFLAYNFGTCLWVSVPCYWPLTKQGMSPQMNGDKPTLELCLFHPQGAQESFVGTSASSSRLMSLMAGSMSSLSLCCQQLVQRLPIAGMRTLFVECRKLSSESYKNHSSSWTSLLLTPSSFAP